MTLLGAIKELHDLRNAEDVPFYYKPVIAEIINVLLMDTQEVTHGRWVGIDDFPHKTWECNRCGKIIVIDEPPNYCESCGADMREENDHE